MNFSLPLEIAKAFIEFLFPHYCIFCLGRQDNHIERVCTDCTPNISFIADVPHCSSCGKKMKYHQICITCATNTSYLSEIKSIFLYNQHISKFIRYIKFADKTYLIRHCAELLCQHFIKDIQSCDFIIPVPISNSRMFSRMYNQSAILAKKISKISSVAFYSDVLLKTVHTSSQLSLSMEQRKQNLQGVFAVKNSPVIKGATIAIIDDVITTGTTVSRCAEALAPFSPKKIIAISIARSILQ